MKTGWHQWFTLGTLVWDIRRQVSVVQSSGQTAREGDKQHHDMWKDEGEEGQMQQKQGSLEIV